MAALAANGAPASARVIRLKGPARISTDHTTWQALKAGDSIAAGSLVQTAVKAQMDLDLDGRATSSAPAFEKANVVSLAGESVLNVNKLAVAQADGGAVQGIELELLNGEIEGHFRKPPPGSMYEIIFPKGALGIRGADFQLTAAGVVEVSAGSLVISTTIADGSLVTKEVTSGQRFDPDTGLVTAAGQTRMPPPQPKASLEEPKPQSPATPDDPLRELPKRKF